MRPGRKRPIAAGMRCALAAAVMAAGAAPSLAQPGTDAAGLQNPRLADERVLLRTVRGDLVIGLYRDAAPSHVEQILTLVRLGVYDSTWFHRVEPNFLVQLSNAQNRRNRMTPAQARAIRKLPAESSNLPHRRGTVSMAREEGDLNSAETSFSILLASAPHLDGNYTIVGELVWGDDVLEIIATAPRDANNQPLTEIRVESALVKTAAELEQMQAAGQLRTAFASTPAASGGAGAGASSPTVVVAGIAVMMLLSLCGFLLAGRLPPHRVGAFSLLTILVGAFLLVRELVPRAKGSALLATMVFFGIVALFKLMNRFESTRPGSSAPQTGTLPATGNAGRPRSPVQPPGGPHPPT